MGKERFRQGIPSCSAAGQVFPGVCVTTALFLKSCFVINSCGLFRPQGGIINQTLFNYYTMFLKKIQAQERIALNLSIGEEGQGAGRKKITESKRLPELTELPLIQISARLEFSSQNYFQTLFNPFSKGSPA
jgi:hypothetical protein